MTVKTISTGLVLSAWLLACADSGLGQQQTAPQFWVSPEGSDRNPGTRDEPFASPAAALRKVRDLRRLDAIPTNQPARILLRGGLYHLDGPLLIRSEDSGTETSPTVFEAAPAETPVLSGGVSVTGWRRPREEIRGLPANAQKQVWVADAPQFAGRTLEVRQLWVSDRKAVRARTPNGDTLERIAAWDKARQEAWIPASALGDLRDPARLEMVVDQIWEIAVLRVRSLRLDTNAACLTFHQPESRIEFEHPYPAPVFSRRGNSAFYLANAIEFLDSPGEWFQEIPGGKIYYWPRPGEDMARDRAFVPALETLVQISGTLDRPVTHLVFNGITFAHAAWNRPAQAGHVPFQAGMFLLDAYSLSPRGTAEQRTLNNWAWIGRPPAGVSVNGAHHVRFERCRFERMASAGLDFESGTHDNTIEGCVFRDLGGNGIQLGKFSDPGLETHVAYNPSDEREVCSREKISNNLISDCGTEDWGCVGIGVGYGRGVVIEHNEVRDLPYTGISVGWGWTKATNCMSGNRILANHIHHVARRLGDTGGIYTLSAQPGTVIAENSIHDIRLSPYTPDTNHWFYVYLDEGSSFVTVRDNWCPAEKFMRNANGPGNVWTNNGPTVSETIKAAAGLEPRFQDLLRANPVPP